MSCSNNITKLCGRENELHWIIDATLKTNGCVAATDEGLQGQELGESFTECRAYNNRQSDFWEFNKSIECIVIDSPFNISIGLETPSILRDLSRLLNTLPHYAWLIEQRMLWVFRLSRVESI